MRGKKLSFGARSDGRAAGRRAAMTAVENSPEGARRTPEAGRERGDASFLLATPPVKDETTMEREGAMEMPRAPPRLKLRAPHGAATTAPPR